MAQEQLRFPGFPEKPIENYWQYPQIMNGFWHALTPIEQKVLDYILRHTWGWQKNSDYISYSQIKNGIKGVDRGTGIKSDRTISKALKGLVDKNMIKKISGKAKGITNHYSLVLNEGRQEVKRGSANSKEGGLARSKDTINNDTINTNNKYPFSFKKKKPYFRGKPMLFNSALQKWYVIENGDWLEFVGQQKDVEWK